MTEQQWLNCKKRPDTMIAFLCRTGRTTDRKLRLYACACARHVWFHLVAEDQSRRLVEINEQYADGLVSREEVVAAARPAWEAVGMSIDCSVESRGSEESPEKRAAVAALLAGCNGRSAAGYFTEKCWRRGNRQEMKKMCQLLRDIIGNPFRRVSLDPAWLTWNGGLVVSMARRMYESRDYSDMPVLADALEESGCSDPDILRHCREPGEHVRGCWLIDLLLGKA